MAFFSAHDDDALAGVYASMRQHHQQGEERELVLLFGERDRLLQLKLCATGTNRGEIIADYCDDNSERETFHWLRK